MGDLTIPLHTPDFPVQKPVSPSSMKKPNQTKQNKNKNKQTDKNKNKQKKNNVDRISFVLVFRNASNFRRFGVVYFALLVDARVAVTF